MALRETKIQAISVLRIQCGESSSQSTRFWVSVFRPCMEENYGRAALARSLWRSLISGNHTQISEASEYAFQLSLGVP